MKILVRGTNWVGDAVMSVPALKALRRVFPDALISLHTRSWAEGLFQDADFIDDIVTYDRHKWAIKDVLDNSRFLRDDKYDLAVLFPNSFESALTTLLTKIPRRIGYNKDLRGLLLTDPVPVPEWKGRRHEVYYYLHLAAEVERRVLGSRSIESAGEPDISIDVSDDRRATARELLHSNGVTATSPIVALGIGSQNSRAKRWPAERYAALADRLSGELGASVILVGSEEDSDAAAKVQEHSSSRLIDLTGRTTLSEAVAILALADLLVANDMGLAHVAAAVDKPTIVIFGPTKHETTRPYSLNALIVRKDVECSPCMLRDCPIDHRCMTRISVDEIFEASRAALTQIDDRNDETPGGFS
ncbi:MAG: lipopolysaccharide heptosyltransferase II [Acidobacteriota bacterium]|nr:MAG: lipopolysaccharide heptosyltransferase II [Acidobacteriota bacterium]